MCFGLLEYTPAVSANSVSFASESAPWNVETQNTESKGPNTSSCARRELKPTWSKIAGGTKYPLRSVESEILPSATRRHPSLCACATYERNFATASSSTRGPTLFFGSSGEPIGRLFTRSERRLMNASYRFPSSPLSSTTIRREHAEHFCPLNPNAESHTPTTASSKSASESTIIAFFPPDSSASERFSCRSRGGICESPDVLNSAMARCMSCLTLFEPVKATADTDGCLTR